MPHIAVLGAGITGITTAFALHQRGFDVTVFDRQRYAAMETSFANGGQLSASNAEVWNQWSTVLKGLKWMLQADAPLSVNPRPSWHKMSWMAEFLANIPRYRRNTIETARLAVQARSGLLEMAERAGVDFDFSPAGILHFYKTQTDLDHARKVTGLLAQGGFLRWGARCATRRRVRTALILTAHGLMVWLSRRASARASLRGSLAIG